MKTKKHPFTPKELICELCGSNEQDHEFMQVCSCKQFASNSYWAFQSHIQECQRYWLDKHHG